MLENVPYKASFTREQFMFYEMKITARMVQEGLSDNQIIEKIYTENMFQYPTEKSTKRMVKACLTRLRCMGDDALVTAIANEPQDVAKQICLYAMMKQYRVIGEFMVTVIGEKYRLKCLIYMHRYAPDTIARIRTDYVHEMQAKYRTEIEGLETRIATASTSERVKLNKKLVVFQVKAEELRDYEEKIHHYADAMIDIDLDDGVKVNYAKFADVLAKVK